MLGELPNLTALHLENLRKVDDFSVLQNLQSLRCLSMGGTLDHKQKVQNFEFLRGLQRLEVLKLTGLNVLAKDVPYLPFEALTSLKSIYIASDVFELEFFAWFQVTFRDVDGSVRVPYDRYGGDRQQVSGRDVFATMPEEQLRKEAPFIEIDADRSRWRNMANGATLLGKGERTAQASKATVDAKCAAHAAHYEGLLEKFSR